MNELKKNPLFRFLSSYWLSVILLVMLLILTWLGTLEQREHGIYKIQKDYFESVLVVYHAGPIPIPLPGAYAVMVVLFINLVLGGLMRVRWTWGAAGVITTHLGILLLLVSSFVSHSSSVHGNVTLYEGESSAEFRSHFLWEIAVYPAPEMPDGKPVREHLIPHQEFVGLGSLDYRVFRGKDLPLEFTLNALIENAWPKAEGQHPPTNPVVEGVYLEERESAKEAVQNILGAFINVRVVADVGDEKKGELAILWGDSPLPFLVETPKGRWAIELRKKRSNLPFGLRLDKFTHAEVGRAVE